MRNIPVNERMPLSVPNKLQTLGCCLFAKDVELNQLFEEISEDRKRFYVDLWLGKLAGRDPDDVKELWVTLETFIASDGQVNETAKRLFIHRNTATYRIDKLEELMGINLKQPDNLLKLRLAFMFRDMLYRLN